MTRVLAVDLGGTRLKAAAVVDGSVGPVLTEPTAGLSIAAACEAIAAIAARLGRADGWDAIGLCVPGVVGPDGRILSLPGKFPGAEGFDLPGVVGTAVGAPVTVANDAIAYAAGEAAAGAAVGAARAVVLTIGTGVGVAVVAADGAGAPAPLGDGPFGGGLLAGQIPVADPATGPADTNGQRGTIEALCAAPRLVDLAREHGCPVEDVPALLAAWRRSERPALAAVTAYRRRLEQALVALAHAYAPSVIVVGGGPVAGHSGWLLDGMTETLRPRLWPGLTVTVRACALGDGAALAGIAALAAARTRVPEPS